MLVVQLPLITCNGKIRQDSDARRSLLRNGEIGKIAPSAKASERGVGQSYPNQYEVLVPPQLHALLVVHEEKQHLPLYKRMAGPINDNECTVLPPHEKRACNAQAQ